MLNLETPIHNDAIIAINGTPGFVVRSSIFHYSAWDKFSCQSKEYLKNNKRVPDNLWQDVFDVKFTTLFVKYPGDRFRNIDLGGEVGVIFDSFIGAHRLQPSDYYFKNKKALIIYPQKIEGTILIENCIPEIASGLVQNDVTHYIKQINVSWDKPRNFFSKLWYGTGILLFFDQAFCRDDYVKFDYMQGSLNRTFLIKTLRISELEYSNVLIKFRVQAQGTQRVFKIYYREANKKDMQKIEVNYSGSSVSQHYGTVKDGQAQDIDETIAQICGEKTIE